MQQRMIEYHAWATDRLLAVIEELTPGQFNQQLESSFPSIRETLLHMVVVDYVWLVQLGTTVDGTDLDELVALAEPAAFRPVWQRMTALLLERATTLDPLQVITAETKSGGRFEITAGEILHHVTTHGAYHRGQLATMIRQVGATPPQQVDAMHYYRQHPIL